MKARDYKAAHFLWSVDDDGVATLTLNRPERKNPLTFDSYAECATCSAPGPCSTTARW
jgi:enoyl-CoA hydratase/carnithine racemase